MTNDLRLHDNAAYAAYVAAPAPKTAVVLLDDAFGDDRKETRSGRVFMKAVKEIDGVIPGGIKEVRVRHGALPKMFNGARVIISFDTTPFARERLAALLAVAATVDIFDTKHLVPMLPRGRLTLAGGTYSSKELRKVISEAMGVNTAKIDDAEDEKKGGKSEKDVTPSVYREKPYKVYSSFYKTTVDMLITDDIIGIPHHIPGTTTKDAPKIRLHETAMKYVAAFDPHKYRRMGKASVHTRQGATNASWAIARGIISAHEMYEAVRRICFPRNFESFRSRDREGRKMAFVDFVRELLFRDFYSRATWWWLKRYGHRFRNASSSIAPGDRKEWKVTSISSLIKNIKAQSTPLVIKTIYDNLVADGTVSNYGRMLFATFVYDIGCDWQVGERLFRHYLIDYDFSSNHWNWAHHSIQGLNYQWPSRKYKVENVTLDV